ncbi:MAG TPA: hypothetical protein DCG75_15600 [Bacteroidales bacterium]|jgi:O-antigen/teichoic acid export membrane protein|nr:hypothetical protein [Bacteroidales bacterium]
MFKQILNTFITRILSGVLNLLIAIILSNYLGAEGKGVQGLILTTISIIVIFSGIVGSGGLTYLLPRMHFSLLIIPCYLWAIINVGIMCVVLRYFDIIPKEYINDVVFLALVLSITGINNSILHAKKLIQQVNLVSITQVVITLIVIIYLVIYKDLISVRSYVIGMYFGCVISALVSYWYAWKNYTNTLYFFPFHKYFLGIKNHFKYGGFNQLDILAQLLSFRFAFYILNYYTTTAQVGIYSNAVSLIEAIWILSRSISFVQHSRIVNSHDKNYTSNLTLQFIKLSGSIAFVAIIALVVIPSGVYRYVFGSEFGEIRIALISLSPGVLFFSISFIISSYFSGTGKHYLNSISSAIGLMIIVILAFVLIPDYGIVGAGIAASASYFTTTVVKIHYFIKLTGIKFLQLFPVKNDLHNLLKLIRSLKNG